MLTMVMVMTMEIMLMLVMVLMLVTVKVIMSVTGSDAYHWYSKSLTSGSSAVFICMQDIVLYKSTNKAHCINQLHVLATVLL